MELLIDLAWLLERQALLMPRELDVADYSALAAAVQRHRVNTPRIGYEPDNAWRAAALLVTIAREEPLPARNSFFAALTAVEYMAQAGEAVDAPPGALPELVAQVRTYKTDVYGAAERLRGWRG
ncbi:toxin Doc [Streptomyces abyssomicinicus]|uniref:toxin Doc n=1 Tax=Streptomyces abyssomicinicus TaxID=574929 RepID=UPI00124FAB4D|nr:toxin Doc [Streptomyces abyssomicinicus]